MVSYRSIAIAAMSNKGLEEAIIKQITLKLTREMDKLSKIQNNLMKAHDQVILRHVNVKDFIKMEAALFSFLQHIEQCCFTTWWPVVVQVSLYYSKCKWIPISFLLQFMNSIINHCVQLSIDFD